MTFDKNRNGFRFPKLGKQEFIKYFFGGNAGLAVLILVLICVFLVKEAWLFFPSHHEQLKIYRKSGLEYFSWIDDAHRKYKADTDGLKRAHDAELAHPNVENQALIMACESTRLFAERELGDSLLMLRDAIRQRAEESGDDSERARKLDQVIGRIKSRIIENRAELAKAIQTTRFLGIPLHKTRVAELRALGEVDRESVINAVVGQPFWEDGDSPFYRQIKEQFDQVHDSALEEEKTLQQIYETFAADIVSPLETIWKEASEQTRSTRDRAISNEIVPGQIQDLVNAALASKEPSVRLEKYGEILMVVADAEFFDEYARLFYLYRFTEAIFDLSPDGSAYDKLPPTTRERVEGILNGATGNHAEFLEVLETGGDELDSFPKAVPAETMDPDMRQLLFDLTRVDKGSDKVILELSRQAGNFLKAFPYDKEARKIYDMTERYNEAVREIKNRGRAELEKFPDPFTLKTRAARDEMARFQKTFQNDVATFEAVGRRLDEWKFDKPWSWRETAASFFLDSKWTQSSQILDRYGIIPLLTGSLIISAISLTIAVPISILGAIYVNQIAPLKERRFLRTGIELIGAIPSVVVGFLGIVVAGQLLEELSAWPVFSWFPGFPIESRFNMLLAGLLLAFMAIPIIFTRADEALTRVPSALRDGALSLGATPTQTAFRIVLPASLSGMAAAVLLGFGRVIGDTMIVLMLAGNRIAIPNFSEGLGLITEPGQPMPGIIAGDLGEAAADSVDYRALFLVGLFLFMITLVINFVGQKILARHGAEPRTSA